ncbi:hypothetical protein LCGC14_0274140 [marine sediment metagenome]|uniref:Uncharacterized protein n=2 Tax=root TaxID=1 RepID=A0A9C9ND69_9HYPH|nr:hypothetical protein [Aurantimonas coralicida]
MRAKTAKLIAACGKALPGETEESLLRQWRRASTRERGQLRARWTHQVKTFAARSRKMKADRAEAKAQGKVHVPGFGAVAPPPGSTVEQFEKQVKNMRRKK